MGIATRVTGWYDPDQIINDGHDTGRELDLKSAKVFPRSDWEKRIKENRENRQAIEATERATRDAHFRIWANENRDRPVGLNGKVYVGKER